MKTKIITLLPKYGLIKTEGLCGKMIHKVANHMPGVRPGYIMNLASERLLRHAISQYDPLIEKAKKIVYED